MKHCQQFSIFLSIFLFNSAEVSDRRGLSFRSTFRGSPLLACHVLLWLGELVTFGYVENSKQLGFFQETERERQSALQICSHFSRAH